MQGNAFMKSDPIATANQARAEIEAGQRDWITGAAWCVVIGLVLAVVIWASAVSA